MVDDGKALLDNSRSDLWVVQKIRWVLTPNHHINDDLPFDIADARVQEGL
jgi:hypothetical protein